MRKKYIFGKKLYISVLTSILVLLTTVATTFAWVGVFANSTFESFNIGIKASDLDEYGVEISLTGEEGSFSDTVDDYQLKKQILLNWGYSENTISNNNINDLFYTLNMHQCTNLPVIENNKIIKLNEFKTIEGTITHNYFKFDLYVAATKYYNTSSTSDFLLDAYLQKGMLTGSIKNYTLKENYIFPNDFINPLSNLPSGIRKIEANEEISSCNVNSASSTRVAFEKYEVVSKGHPELYEGKSPLSTVIYSGDSYDFPTYNSDNNTYEFGGILRDEYNLATCYFNSYEYRLTKNGIKHLSIPSDIYNSRGVESSTKDLILSSTTNHLIDSSKETEKIDLQKMIKLTISFWFEGWDADCFSVLNASRTTLLISLSASNEEIF